MEKKIILLIIVIVFLFNAVNVSAKEKTKITWQNPPATPSPYVLGNPIGNTLDITIEVACITSPCSNVNAKLQYCKGVGCTNYVGIGSAGDLGLVTGLETQPLGDITPITPKTALWTIKWPTSMPGDKYDLNIVITYGGFPIITETFGGRDLIRDITEINSVAGDTSKPYIDTFNDNETNMELEILGNVTECRFSNVSSFNPSIGNGTACDDPDEGTITCQLDTEGDFFDGSYTRYYSCKNGDTVEWLPNQAVNFSLNLTSMLNAVIVSPEKQDNPETATRVRIGSKIDFNSNITSNFFDFVVDWNSENDPNWHHSDENFSSNELGIGDHNVVLTVTFYTGASEPITKTDWVLLSILPISSDVMAITKYEIIAVNPITIESIIQVDANIELIDPISVGGPLDGNAVLSIINAETGEKVFEDSSWNPHFYSGLGENYLSEEHIYSIDLKNDPAEPLEEGNYKIILDVREYPPEQNTENNHRSEIITVLKQAPQSPTLSEVSIIVVPLLVIVILAILNKRKIKEYLEKRKSKKQ